MFFLKLFINLKTIYFNVHSYFLERNRHVFNQTLANFLTQNLTSLTVQVVDQNADYAGPEDEDEEGWTGARDNNSSYSIARIC